MTKQDSPVIKPKNITHRLVPFPKNISFNADRNYFFKVLLDSSNKIFFGRCSYIFSLNSSNDIIGNGRKEKCCKFLKFVGRFDDIRLCLVMKSQKNSSCNNVADKVCTRINKCTTITLKTDLLAGMNNLTT